MKHDVLAITDEIYEHIIYDGQRTSDRHAAGMAERTVTISGLSKTFSVTGWRIGWTIAPPEVTDAIRRCTIFSPSARRHRCRWPALRRSRCRTATTTS